MERITAAAAAEGFHPAPDEVQADRTVVIAQPADSEWLVVYDENGDGMDEKAIDALGRALSENAPTITSLVADSDELQIGLFRDGKRADRIRFDPGSGKLPRPKVKTWQKLLGPGTSEFIGAFAGESAFAEGPLETLGKLLRWDQTHASLGYGHIDELPQPPVAVLKFAISPERRFYTLRQGPPDLHAPVEKHREQLAMGLRAEGMGCSAAFINEGGRSRGLIVLIERSDALDEHLEVDGVSVSSNDGKVTMKAAIQEDVSGQKRFLHASLPEWPLAPYPDWGDLEAWQTMKVNNLLQAASFWVVIHGNPRKTGTFSIPLYAAPLENRRDGMDRVQIDIEVVAEKWW